MTSFIKIQGVSLKYPSKNIYTSSLKQKIIRPFIKNKRHTLTHSLLIESIRDLNLCLESGNKIGVIGKNGAGKSSLLKLMAGIYPPTKGFITTKGKVNAIMNASLGLRNDLSGYENIIHKGILLGLKVREIKSKIANIAEFAEVQERLYNPLSSYSSGMKMRLALGILLAVESDILLIDEVFGTLDIQFMAKYRRALANNINQSAITVFVSHSFDVISTFCSDVIWLENGERREMGDQKTIIERYVKYYENPPIIEPLKSQVNHC